MNFKRIVPSLLILLLLAGCYRQAGDAFETVGGQDIPPPVIEQDPTATVIIIDPSDDAPPIDDLALTATAIADDVMDDAPPLLPPTDEPIIQPTDVPAIQPTDVPAIQPTDVPVIQPTDVPAVQPTDVPAVQPTATPTVIVIQLEAPTNTPAVIAPSPQAQQDAPSLLPTSTPPTFITPAPVEQLPTEVPVTPDSPQNTPSGLVTPTALPEQLPPECVYIVRSGDNLFRIALNNNVALPDLLAANNLVQTSIIQPGQELRLPGCVPQATEPTAPDTPATALPTGTALHTVASGETLSVIARRYGVSVADIVSANNLPNPDRLSVGQQLIIPNQ